MEINEAVVRRVLATVDAGLVYGLGNPAPGRMCVQAAVCYALGLPHSDDPECVSRAARIFALRLNDVGWSSSEARAWGLRRYAIAQLGTAGVLDEIEFARRVAQATIRICVPAALHVAAGWFADDEHRESLLQAAQRCEREPTGENAQKARDVVADVTYGAVTDDAYDAAEVAAKAANVAFAATSATDALDVIAIVGNAVRAAIASMRVQARDETLAAFVESVVQILIDLGAPGARWLYLTEDHEVGA